MGLFDWLKRASGYTTEGPKECPREPAKPADVSQLSASDMQPKWDRQIKFTPSRNHRNKNAKPKDHPDKFHGQRYTYTDIKGMPTSMMFDVLNRHENKGKKDLKSLRQAFVQRVIKGLEGVYGTKLAGISFNEARFYYTESRKLGIRI